MVTELDFIHRVLRLFSDQECRDDLFFGYPDCNGNNLYLGVICSDVFDWGCAGSEEITPENIGELERAVVDAGKDRFDSWGFLLFCARQQKRLPQAPVMKEVPEELRALFEEAGK